MYYQPLFNYMADNHHLVLSDSEMENLINFINREYIVIPVKVEELKSDGVEEKLVEEW